ncbi:MAG: phosphoglucosamine mutase [Candidatus Bathyarchaeota archaeon]|nr:MAG: phosphoglucosamine mutase [Candidatus Bathyarchaeota archaeon]
MRLFGSSGIRGLANIEVGPLLAQRVGAAIASMFEGGAAIVGRDTRLSGEMIELALTSGLVSCGFVAGILGVVPTPLVAWLTKEMEAEVGISISASHNPPQYNGLKVFDKTGMAYTDEQQRRLEGLVESGEFMTSTWSRVGRVEPMEAKRFYIEALAQLAEAPLEQSLVCDLFNGATCTVAPDAFEELGSSAMFINAQPDGHFPSGDPEPTRESLGRLGKMVRTVGAEIGFGFDGDGDRMMAVDEKGEVPSPDRLLAAYAGYLVEGNKGGVVVTHVGASMSVDEAVEKAGGSVVRTKVGDVHISEAVIKHEAVFGGEPVGAWVHPDVHLCPDGILSALKLMLALEAKRKTLSEFTAGIPEYPTLRAKVVCPDSKKESALKSISRYEEEFGEVKEVNTVDGVRLQLDDGWVLIRPSGTEPIIRITVEANNEKRAQELLDTSRSFVQAVLGG